MSTPQTFVLSRQIPNLFPDKSKIYINLNLISFDGFVIPKSSSDDTNKIQITSETNSNDA